jgi:ParB family chromosome partitioning protein
MRVKMVDIDTIRPNPGQPRRVFDPEGLRELARSIRLYGVLQPLTVRRMADGPELIAGERRLRAAKMAGLKQVPCIFVSVDQNASGVLALIENLQRQDLDWLEEAEGLARLIRLYGMSQEQAASAVGLSQSAVSNKLRLLKHPPQILEALRKWGLSERHGRELLRLPVERRLDAVEVMGQRAMTVAGAQRYIDGLLAEKPKKPDLHRAVRDGRMVVNSIEKELKRLQGLGAACSWEKREENGEIVVRIRIL